jgi:hypothetical protein
MSQLQVTGEAKVRDIQGPVVANSGVITALDGDASQYVRGDGTLADFPTSTGGGSSVSYYLNSSVSQGTIGGVAYRQLSKTPISGAGTDITASTNGYIASYLTDANDPALLEVPAGNFNCEFYFSVNSNNHNPYVYAELYKYDGTTFTLLGSSQSIPEYLTNGTTLSAYYFAIPVAVAALTITDRLAIRIYVNVDGRVVTLHTENNHLCQVVTTFSKGLTSLNNLTRQVQFLATGTSGTDFNIVSSVATHTFNLPVASATNTGKLSSTDWSTFNNKVPYTGATAALDMGNNSITTSNFIFGKAIELDAGVEEVGGRVIFRQRAATSGGGANYTTFGAQSNNNVNFSFWQDAPSGINRYKFFTFSVDNLTLNLNRTYQMPDASGTLALTSNLSSYVPYTGATTNVNLGVYSLTSNQLIAGAPGTNNVATFTTADQGNALHLKGSTGDLIFVPYFSPSVGARITAQDTAGSANTPLSLVASTINIVGDLIGKAATFGGNIVQLLTIDSAAIGGSYIALKKQGTLNGAIGMGANTIATNTDTDLGLWATGLIAFQTNSVVRLTIASTGAATFTSSVTASSLVKSGGTSSQFLMADGSVNTSVLPSGAYLPLSGGTLTGALSGTSATFTNASGAFIAVTATTTDATGSARLRVTSTGSNINDFSSFSASHPSRANQAWIGGDGSSTTTVLQAGGTEFLRGTSTGAATFSSSVAANGVMSLGNDGTYGSTYKTLGLTGNTDGTHRIFGGTSDDLYIAAATGRGINFWTNGVTSTRMFITSGGNVGIGTSSPSQLLHIQKDQNASTNLLIRNDSSGASAETYMNVSNGTYLTAIGTRGTGTAAFNALDTNSGMLNYNGNTSLTINATDASAVIKFTTNNFTERMRITSGGDVCVKTSTASFPASGRGNITIAGDAGQSAIISFKVGSTDRAYIFVSASDTYIDNTDGTGNVVVLNGSGGVKLERNATSWTSNSDERLKNINGTIENAIDKLNTLRAVNFSWKTDETNKQVLGLIAQDVEKVFPQVVNKSKLSKSIDSNDNDNTEYLGVRYTELIPVLVAAIQEQTQIIKDLEARIVSLESK